MMDIVEAMRGVTQEELRNLWMPQLGVVTSVFPHSSKNDKDNYECNVRLKNPDVELRRVQIATQVIGLAGAPSVGDLVLVVFVNGDLNYPVVIGRLYNDEDRPPVNEKEEVVYVAPFKKNSKARRVYLEFPDGMKLKITDEEVDIRAGETTILIKKDGDVTIKSKGDVAVTADGDTSLSASGKMKISGSSVSISSKKEIDMKSGTDLNMEANQATQIKAAKIGMESKTEFKASSKGDLSMEATAAVKLDSEGLGQFQAKGPMVIKGAVVNIN